MENERTNLEELKEKEKELWLKACAFEGFDGENEKFVVFSSINPFNREREKIVKKIQFVQRCMFLINTIKKK